jgi:hypothetical protein
MLVSFLVASYIEQRFKDYLVWIPSRDSGVDLLLRDKDCRNAVSIQVKFSRDFLAFLTCLARCTENGKLSRATFGSLRRIDAGRHGDLIAKTSCSFRTINIEIQLVI